uniref:Uncharacterized protein n=1 Tax=Tetranychus urticae TaxID=32264 RepID=T1KB66_TETUR
MHPSKPHGAHNWTLLQGTTLLQITEQSRKLRNTILKAIFAKTQMCR